MQIGRVRRGSRKDANVPRYARARYSFTSTCSDLPTFHVSMNQSTTTDYEPFLSRSAGMRESRVLAGC